MSDGPTNEKLTRLPISSETPIPETIDFKNYSSETLNNKAALERNPACLISIEKDTGNTMVRNEIRDRDPSGNETRYYIYNIVNKDQIFAATNSEFVPGRYLADEVDREISIFLKKGISKPEDIKTIEDARVAVLAGVIDRRDYQAIEQRIENEKKGTSQQTLEGNNSVEPHAVEGAVAQDSQTVTTIRQEKNELTPDQLAEVLILELTEKYLSEKSNSISDKFENLLQDLEKVDNCIAEIQKQVLSSETKEKIVLLQDKIRRLQELKTKIIDLKNKTIK